MKQIFSLILSICLLLSLTACGGQTSTEQTAETPTWQEQYDLGIRYLSEGNYEEAIIAFTAAIEIDPKQSAAYVSRGTTYLHWGAGEALSSAQTDFETALELDKTLADAWMGLANVYLKQEAHDEAIRVLEEGLNATGADRRLAEKLAELKETFLAEPGSEEFLQNAERHLAPDLVNFDFAVGGTPIATADIHTVADLFGGQAEFDDVAMFYTMEHARPAGALQWSYSEVVNSLWLLDLTNRKEDIRIWPSEYFARIDPYDTLEQALERLGFTEEEQTYLKACPKISLYYRNYGGDVFWDLQIEDSEHYPKDECQLNIVDSDRLSYNFTFSMEEAGFERGTPVDGRAALQILHIVNNTD